MVFRVEDIQNVCTVLGKLSAPVTTSVISQLIELRTENNKLQFMISDQGFSFVGQLDATGDLHAVVESAQFLNLVSKVTTETIKLEVEDKSLVVEANGKYRLPLIYKDDKLIDVAQLDIETVSSSWTMHGDDLASIERYNLDICANPVVVDPLQRYVYIDKEGAVTFSTRACINNFNSTMPVKVLAPQFLVKTFPLYKGKEVEVEFGYTAITDTFNQPRIRFNSGNYVCTYSLPFTDEQLNEYPTTEVRALGSENYDHSVVLPTKELIGCVERFSVFYTTDILKYIKIEFDEEKMTLKGKNNKETIYYDNKIVGLTPYEIEVDLFDFKPAIDQGAKFTTLHFGNENSISLVYGNINNVITLIEE